MLVSVYIEEKTCMYLSQRSLPLVEVETGAGPWEWIKKQGQQYNSAEIYCSLVDCHSLLRLRQENSGHRPNNGDDCCTVH